MTNEFDYPQPFDLISQEGMTQEHLASIADSLSKIAAHFERVDKEAEADREYLAKMLRETHNWNDED